jgi:hypothetical protein
MHSYAIIKYSWLGEKIHLLVLGEKNSVRLTWCAHQSVACFWNKTMHGPGPCPFDPGLSAASSSSRIEWRLWSDAASLCLEALQV